MSTLPKSPPPTTTAGTRPFGIRDRIGYLFGDLGNDFTFIFASAYLMVYFTNVAGLQAAHVGLLFLLARLLDAFTDIGWGRFLDRHTPAATGRFRPWIARMAIPVGIASALMYVPFTSEWAYGAKLVFAAATYLLWGSVFYTTTNISYGSMASVMTIVPGQRASLSVFRGIGANIAGLLVSLVPPLIIYTTVDGQSQVDAGRMFITALVFSALAVVWYFVCHANVRERVSAPVDTVHRRGFGALIRSLVSSRPLLALTAVNILTMLGTLLIGAMAAYLWLYHFNNGALSGPAQLTSYLPGLLLAPFAAKLATRFGKKEVVAAFLLLTGGLYVFAFALHITSPWFFIAMAFTAGFGISYYGLMVWALVGDIIDDEERRSGERDDGTVYAVNTWARKLGQAAAGGLGGFALALVGFDSVRTAQTPDTIDGIYMISTLVPGLLYLAAAVLLIVVYPLHRARVQETSAELDRRRVEQETA